MKSLRQLIAERLRQPATIVSICLAIAVFAVFAPVSGYDFVDYDDDRYISENPHIQDGLSSDGVGWAFSTGLTSEYKGEMWLPLTYVSHMLVIDAFGLDPSAHHLANLALHILNTLLLFWILKRMTGTLWRSAAVAALFGLHPLHVEAVAWVTERKYLLSTTFWMLSLWAYARYAERPCPGRYWPPILLFLLALMAKPTVVMLPLALLLLDYWPLRRLDRGAARLVIEKLPFFGLALVFGLIVYWSQRGGGVQAIPFGDRIENAVVSYAAYLGKTVWPSGLAVFYPHPKGALPMWQSLGAALLAAGIAFGALLSRRERPYLTAGWLWHLATLGPLLGLLQVGAQARADRFVYVADIGLFIAAVWGVESLATRWRVRRATLAACAAAALAALAITTARQVTHWKDSVSLFERALAVTSGNFLAHHNLGVALEKRGDLRRALAHYRKAVAIKPDYAEAHNNVGHLLDRAGRRRQAMAHYKQALRVRPDFPQAHNNLAVDLYEADRSGEALAHLEAALKEDPAYADAHNNMGLVLAGLGELERAVSHYMTAVRLDPDLASAHNNLGNALSSAGRLDTAMAHYSEALRLKPELVETHNNLANLLCRQGRTDQALTHYGHALRLRPDSPEIHNNIGTAYLDLERSDDAIRHLRIALHLRPAYPEARKNLAIALKRKAFR